jgi:hypothetical protein
VVCERQDKVTPLHIGGADLTEPDQTYGGLAKSPEASPEGRRYLPTVGELADRYCINLIKSIKDQEHRAEYLRDNADIIHDLLLAEADPYFAHAIMALTLSNYEIYLNEEVARRTGKGGKLRYTHSLNGVRNRAKNVISRMFGQRVDHKIDCLAADLPGNWDLFNER